MIIGVLLAFFTSVCWALGNVFIQKSGRALGAIRAMFFATLAGGLLSSICTVLLDQRTEPLSFAALGWITLAGIAGLFAYVSLYLAFERAQFSLTVPLVASWPLFSSIFSLTLLGEKASAPHLFGAALILAGVILVSVAGIQPQTTCADDRSKRSGALLAALSSAIGFGIMIPALTHAAPVLGKFGASTCAYAVLLIVGLPLALIKGVSLCPPTRITIWLIVAAGCCEVLGFIAMTFAQSFAPLAVIAPVGGLEAVLTLLYAWLFLREKPGLLAGLGSMLACGGMVILSV